MRLALFTDTFAPQMNGVTRTLRRLTDVVRERGGEARVFTTSDPDASLDEHVRRWPSIRCPIYPELRMSYPGKRAALAAMHEFQPTLVHAATPFGVGLAARAAALDLGIPFVTSYHTSFSDYARFYGMQAIERPIWSVLRWFHNSGRRTFCPTESIRSSLASRGFERLAVWSRGVDRRRFTPARRSRAMRLRMGGSDSTVVVAYVGRLAREKGLDHVLGAMGRIASCDSAISFAFAGEGPYLDHCRGAAPATSRFLGRLEGLELAEFYASADVFLFPSSTDTFGNVLIEAMAAGLPILAADAGTSREVVGDAGTWYAAGSEAALASAITELAACPSRRAAHAAHALARSAAFDWEAVFDALFEDYARAAGSDARQATAV